MTTIAVARNHSRDSGMHVLLADNHRARSYHVWALLMARSDVRTISTGESVEEVLSLAAQHAPDLGMVSATSGVSEGLSLAHRLKLLAAAPPVLVYANAAGARLAGAAMIAGADGVFDSEKGAEDLAWALGRVTVGEQVFPALAPDPFRELAACVDEEDRRIVAMLLLGAYPDEIASLLGISAHAFRVRREAIVRRIDAGYAGDRVGSGDLQRPRPTVDHGWPASRISGRRRAHRTPGGEPRTAGSRLTC